MPLAQPVMGEADKGVSVFEIDVLDLDILRNPERNTSALGTVRFQVGQSIEKEQSLVANTIQWLRLPMDPSLDKDIFGEEWDREKPLQKAELMFEIRKAMNELVMALPDQAQRIELERTYFALMLNRFVGLRYRHLEDHQNRVALAALQIAKAMGFSPAQQNFIFRAALVHDLGKLAVPSTLMNMNKKFGDKEKEDMRMHTVHGREMVESLFGIEEGEVAFAHHENVSGQSRYHNLGPDQFSIYAKVLRLADCLDAALNIDGAREYRTDENGKVIKKSLQEFVEKDALPLKGLDFDPSVVEAFLQCRLLLLRTIYKGAESEKLESI